MINTAGRSDQHLMSRPSGSPVLAADLRDQDRPLDEFTRRRLQRQS
jgi:hypothetical protein